MISPRRWASTTFAALRDAVKAQMVDGLASMSRQAMKRQVLDALDEGHKFDVPGQLVEAEFNTIWDRVKHEVEHHGRSFEDEGTTEEEAKANTARSPSAACGSAWWSPRSAISTRSR